MRNRSFLPCEKPDSAQRPALTGQILATTSTALLEDKSLMAPSCGLVDPGKTGRGTAHPLTARASVSCGLERLCDEQSAQLVRRRAVPISWMQSDELPLEINVIRSSVQATIV